jgi:hypothetical protein
MKYEDWIKYELERQNQIDNFAWVSVSENPPRHKKNSLPNSQPDPIRKPKNYPRFSNICLLIHR